MKKIIAIAVFGIFHSLTAHAASNVGQCVFPKAVPGKGGALKFKKPISIYSTADKNSAQTTLTAFSTFSIAKESNGLVQLIEVPGFDTPNPRAGKSIGWAKLSDFDFQDLRNCN